MALAAENALKENGLAADIVVVGFDGAPATFESIKAGEQAATEQVARGAAPDGLTLAMSLAHVASGLTIGVATLARLALRLTRGVPAHAGDTPAWQAAIASIVHWAFYVLLLAMVTTGVLTFLRVAPLGQVHFIINGALVVTIGLHVAGALFNQFVRHDGTLMRMFGRHA